MVVDTSWQAFGTVTFTFTPGIAELMYSGVFTATSANQIGENDTVNATFWDTGESVDEQVSFALTMGNGDPITPAPEPGTLMLLGGALLGLAVLRHQKRS